MEDLGRGGIGQSVGFVIGRDEVGHDSPGSIEGHVVVVRIDHG